MFISVPSSELVCDGTNIEKWARWKEALRDLMRYIFRGVMASLYFDSIGFRWLECCVVDKRRLGLVLF